MVLSYILSLIEEIEINFEIYESLTTIENNSLININS